MSCLSFSFEAKVEVVVYLAENLNNKTNKILNIILQGIPSGFDIMSRPKINQSLDKHCYDTFYLKLLRLSEVKKVSNGSSGINFHYIHTQEPTEHWHYVKTRGSNQMGHLVLTCPFLGTKRFWICPNYLVQVQKERFLIKTLFEQVQINNLCWTVKKNWTSTKQFGPV